MGTGVLINANNTVSNSTFTNNVIGVLVNSTASSSIAANNTISAVG